MGWEGGEKMTRGSEIGHRAKLGWEGSITGSKAVCPIELSVIVEMFYIYTIQYCSHWPHVASR